MSISSIEDPGWSSWDDDDPSRFVDEADVRAPDEVPPWVAIARLEANGEAHSMAALALEDVTIRGRMLVADQYAGVADLLADAAACPDPWVGPDPTLDPAWRDPRDRTASAVRAERRDIAVRAAAADLAVRLGMSETMIRTRAAHADTLRQRCPRVWEAFRNGQVSELNAGAAAQQAASLPSDSPEAWAAFDDGVMVAAQKLPPNKFRLRARAVRERVHPEDLETRHRRAAEDRNMWITPEHDGMASLSVFGPAADIYAAYARADAHARHLREQPGETRTLAQLRADVVADLLVNGETTESGTADRTDAGRGHHPDDDPARPKRRAGHPRRIRPHRHRHSPTTCGRGIQRGEDPHSPRHRHRARPQTHDDPDDHGRLGHAFEREARDDRDDAQP